MKCLACSQSGLSNYGGSLLTGSAENAQTQLWACLKMPLSLLRSWGDEMIGMWYFMSIVDVVVICLS